MWLHYGSHSGLRQLIWPQNRHILGAIPVADNFCTLSSLWTMISTLPAAGIHADHEEEVETVQM